MKTSHNSVKLTLWMSPFVNGYRTTTFVDRAERKVWFVFAQVGGPTESTVQNPKTLTESDLVKLEAFLATTCERNDIR